MRIPSGVTDQYIYFVAVDSTDFTTRETGLSSFTVYRSRNGAAAAAMSTPTINETDSSNMPGVYELLLDEDMTIGAGNDSEEIAYHITQASMAPVTRVIELYRPKITAGETLTVSSGVGESNTKAIDDATAAAARLALSAGQIIPFTVETGTTAASATSFAASDITEATANHYKNRVILWTTGALAGSVAQVTAYVLTSGEGEFTVSTMTDTPSDGDTGIII
jgi:hypothetical protein